MRSAHEKYPGVTVETVSASKWLVESTEIVAGDPETLADALARDRVPSVGDDTDGLGRVGRGIRKTIRGAAGRGAAGSTESK